MKERWGWQMLLRGHFYYLHQFKLSANLEHENVTIQKEIRSKDHFRNNDFERSTNSQNQNNRNFLIGPDERSMWLINLVIFCSNFL